MELLERVVAREQCAGMNSAVVRRFNVVLHVADVQRLIFRQVVHLDDGMNFFPLVPYVEVGALEAIAHPGVVSLFCEVLRLDGAEDKAAKFF